MTKIYLVTMDQILSVSSNPTLAAGDVNTDTVHVDFSEEWNGLAKSAVFFTDNDPTLYEVIMDELNSCTIPHEVLDKPGTLFIGVRGVNTDARRVKTSTLIKYKVKEGAPSGTAVSEEPTPDVIQQLLTAMEALKASSLSTTDVVDHLLSTSTNLPLSANQGRVLSEMLGGLSFRAITQEEYDALTTPDDNTVYIIRG